MATRKSTRAPARETALPTPDTGETSTTRKREDRASFLRGASRFRAMANALDQVPQVDAKWFQLDGGQEVLIHHVMENLGLRALDDQAKGFLRAMAGYFVLSMAGTLTMEMTDDEDADLRFLLQVDSLDGPITHDVIVPLDEDGEPTSQPVTEAAATRSGRDEAAFRTVGMEAVAQIAELIEAARKQVDSLDDWGTVTVLRLLLNRMGKLNNAVSGVLDGESGDTLGALKADVFGLEHARTTNREASHG